MQILRCFEILKLNQGATLNEVNQAHRDLVNIWHPDRFTQNPRLKHKVEEYLKEINIARDKLLLLFSSKRQNKSDNVNKTKKDSTKQTGAKAKNKKSGCQKHKYTAKKESVKCKAKLIKNEIKELPLIDTGVWEIILLIDNPNSNYEQITRRLSPDIAARFLSMAGSAFYGREVKSISHAVRLLGYKQMKKLLITSILFEHFTGKLKNFSFHKFQQQAQLCACTASVFGQITGYKNNEDLFTVGILNNLGKLILAAYYKDEHKKIIELKRSENISITEAETKIIGITHNEIGALALKRYNIPQSICDAIEFHNQKIDFITNRPDFMLHTISKKSAGIVKKFLLPKDFDALKITEKFNGIISNEQSFYKNELKTKLKEMGFQKAFDIVTDEISNMIFNKLNKFLEQK